MVLPSAILVIGIVSCLLGARPQAPVEVVPIGENADAAGIH
ncbi:hypothetical protein [Nocardia sp. NBC_01388]